MAEFWQDPYTLSVLIFIAFLAVLVYKDKKKFKRDSIILLRRTQRGRKTIVKLAESHPTFWKSVGLLGVFTGFAASAFIVKFFIELLFRNAQGLASGGSAVPSLSFVLPTLSSTASSTPGLFLVPFWYWIISIAILVVVHEGLHGVMSAVEKVKIKSLGWGLLLVIPLAFVEPDEKKLVKKSFWAQQRIFAAGSFANFITAVVSILLLSGLVTATLQPAGIAFASVAVGSPAQLANITGIITSINGMDVSTLGELATALEKTGPNKEAIVITRTMPKSIQKETEAENSYTLITIENPDQPSKGFLGIQGVSEAQEVKSGFLPYSEPLFFIQGLLFFLFMINLGVGMANLLPIKPLDGGRMWETVFFSISKKHGKKITSVVSYLTLFLIIINFVMPLL